MRPIPEPVTELPLKSGQQCNCPSWLRNSAAANPSLVELQAGQRASTRQDYKSMQTRRAALPGKHSSQHRFNSTPANRRPSVLPGLGQAFTGANRQENTEKKKGCQQRKLRALRPSCEVTGTRPRSRSSGQRTSENPRLARQGRPNMHRRSEGAAGKPSLFTVFWRYPELPTSSSTERKRPFSLCPMAKAQLGQFQLAEQQEMT